MARAAIIVERACACVRRLFVLKTQWSWTGVYSAAYRAGTKENRAPVLYTIPVPTYGIRTDVIILRAGGHGRLKQYTNRQ